MGRRYSSARCPYRSNHSGWTWFCSQSGATTVRTLRVCRNVSTTHSARLRARTFARMCVESVRCRPRAFNQPCSLHRSTTASREAFFSTQSHQTRPKFGEDRVIESCIRQFQTQAIFPVQAAAYCISSLPIRRILHTLEDGDQG